jgi:hypothetical protein
VLRLPALLLLEPARALALELLLLHLLALALAPIRHCSLRQASAVANQNMQVRAVVRFGSVLKRCLLSRQQTLSRCQPERIGHPQSRQGVGHGNRWRCFPEESRAC